MKEKVGAVADTSSLSCLTHLEFAELDQPKRIGDVSLYAVQENLPLPIRHGPPLRRSALDEVLGSPPQLRSQSLPAARHPRGVRSRCAGVPSIVRWFCTTQSSVVYSLPPADRSRLVREDREKREGARWCRVDVYGAHGSLSRARRRVLRKLKKNNNFFSKRRKEKCPASEGTCTAPVRYQ